MTNAKFVSPRKWRLTQSASWIWILFTLDGESLRYNRRDKQMRKKRPSSNELKMLYGLLRQCEKRLHVAKVESASGKAGAEAGDVSDSVQRRPAFNGKVTPAARQCAGTGGMLRRLAQPALRPALFGRQSLRGSVLRLTVTLETFGWRAGRAAKVE